MKKTLEPKETWGDAISHGLIFTALAALAISCVIAIGWCIAMAVILMFNVAWWLPFVLIVPVIMILVFRYTGFNDYLDSITASNLPPR